ncbi:hypothetical protein FGO68_gene4649 [Halteria grandinella]|uniref:Tetratricopeptide repeat protein n=1 Tax=Halteria grandinella TaxID=5974 RepID=A0A8J8NY52_HALGN|nr:hypothetical protein FGO68_gene4649 [Halteria grandinella]
MNWVAGTKYAGLMSKDAQMQKLYNTKTLSKKENGELFRKIFEEDQQLSKKDPLEVMQQMSTGYLATNAQIRYFQRHPEVFESYIQPFYKMAEKNGMIRVSPNSIIPFVADQENDVIDNLNDLLYERYVEWKLIDSKPNLQQILTLFKDEGNASYRKKLYIRAIESYTQGIDSVSNIQGLDKDTLTVLGQLYTNRALCFHFDEKHQKALEDAQYVLTRLQSDNEKANLRKAFALKGLGRFNEALDAFKHIQSLQPSAQVDQEIKALEELQQ